MENNNKRIDDIVASPNNSHDDLDISNDNVFSFQNRLVRDPSYLNSNIIEYRAGKEISMEARERESALFEKQRQKSLRKADRTYELVSNKNRSEAQDEELKRLLDWNRELSVCSAGSEFNIEDEIQKRKLKILAERTAEFNKSMELMKQYELKKQEGVFQNNIKEIPRVLERPIPVEKLSVSDLLERASKKSQKSSVKNNIIEDFVMPSKKRKIEHGDDGMSVLSSVTENAKHVMENLLSQRSQIDNLSLIVEELNNNDAKTIDLNEVVEEEDIEEFANPANKNGKFRLNAKSIFMTYPKCPIKKEQALEKLRVILKDWGLKNYIIAEENHKDGSKHLHAYVEMEKTCNILKADRLDIDGYHGNYMVPKHKFKVMNYVKKSKNFIENFNSESKEKASVSKKKYIGQQMINGVPLKTIALENPEIMFDYERLKKNYALFLLDSAEPFKGQRIGENLWIYGQSGKGKSQWVHRTHPDAFRKSQTKWWDGYLGQETVVLEDMDTHVLGHYLKLWADNYPVTGEVKGGTIPLMHKRIIITSQYLISDLWKDHKEMREAIQRRFKTVTVTGSFDEGYELKEIVLE